MNHTSDIVNSIIRGGGGGGGQKCKILKFFGEFVVLMVYELNQTCQLSRFDRDIPGIT